MKTFAERLINWYTERKRDLPWRKNQEPYSIWLSEIILQQTRVEQGQPYWEQFMTHFPSIHDLASASEEKVLRLWQGLGYYSRARNLHATAKYISEDLKGVFPSTYTEILKLKGVGPYTAAAIASICFDEPTPVVDGNVFRFASRFFGIIDDISKSGSRKVFEDVLNEVISNKRPGTFNQAMMEYGATICSPSPSCDVCEFNSECYAFRKGIQKSLPTKTGKVKVRNRQFQYLVFKSNDKFYLKKRKTDDVWGGLYDFLLLEGELDEGNILDQLTETLAIKSLLVEDVSDSFSHVLSHQKIAATFYQIQIPDSERKSLEQKSDLKPYSVEEMLNLPKPKLIVNYLQRIGIK